MCPVIALLLTIAVLDPSALVAQKREQFRNAEINYEWVTDNRGDQLRTFVTRPKAAVGRVPVIFFVGWLSCDSVEYAEGETDGFGAILWRMIEQSGYATVRMDKPGVGESKGDCGRTDFLTELSGYQAAFDSIYKHDFIDPDRIFVVGLSNGGGTSVLVPRQHPVRGYIAASSWGRTWYEHMLELERVRLTSAAKSPGEVDSAMKIFSQFYNLYLNQRMTPGEVIAQHPEWKDLWYDQPDDQYGRPAAFYQQLQALNLGEAWHKINVPVLVLHGTADSVMSDADSRTIADIVNRSHPVNARYIQIDAADHLLSVKNKLNEKVVPAMLEWMRENAN
jgi:pimeloyl-ACP methyl ester carboxylesterase